MPSRRVIQQLVFFNAGEGVFSKLKIDGRRGKNSKTSSGTSKKQGPFNHTTLGPLKTDAQSLSVIIRVVLYTSGLLLQKPLNTNLNYFRKCITLFSVLFPYLWLSSAIDSADVTDSIPSPASG
jgi:hypothetical protein